MAKVIGNKNFFNLNWSVTLNAIRKPINNTLSGILSRAAIHNCVSVQNNYCQDLVFIRNPVSNFIQSLVSVGTSHQIVILTRHLSSKSELNKSKRTKMVSMKWVLWVQLVAWPYGEFIGSRNLVLHKFSLKYFRKCFWFH